LLIFKNSAFDKEYEAIGNELGDQICLLLKFSKKAAVLQTPLTSNHIWVMSRIPGKLLGPILQKFWVFI